MSWFQDTTRCYHPGGTQHRFEPRYNERRTGPGAMPANLPADLSPDGMVKVVEAIRRIGIIDVYIHDVCVWCGKIVYSERHGEWNVTVTKDPSDPVRASDPKDPTPAQNPSDSPA